uniref:CCHC-type domain-containing protein n=1 Tax=Haemonchus contortus TaxID=6289 RepID=A0A7I5EEG1_HAECO
MVGRDEDEVNMEEGIEEFLQEPGVVKIAKQLKDKADAPRCTDVDSEKDSNVSTGAAVWSTSRVQMRHYAQTYAEEPRRQQGQSLTMDMLNCFQSLSCADPGVYKGKLNENFKDFVRRFRRKYQRVVMSDEILIEILGDDHLGGRAKSVFLPIPAELKRRGFEVVIEKLGKLLAEDSVDGRMRAIAELREMRIRPNQEVADFCVALEKLGRKANPQGRLEDSSLEFAHILLTNLREWPEYTQLLSALHRTTPEKAYEEVKQFAFSIELSKRMYGGTYEKEDRYRHWWLRAKAYSNNEESNVGKVSRSTEVMETRKEDKEITKQGYLELGSGNPQNHPPRTPERSSFGGPAERKYGDSKECFKSSKFGHIAKECTQRTQTADSPKTSSPAVGKRMACWTRMLECRVPALLDTGSMISIVPVRVLARDVDRLELIKDDKNVPVHDAFNNRMEFMSAVRIIVELEGGRSSDVAFYIVDSCDDEVLLGTNALSDLGVDLTISQVRSGIRRERGVETQTRTVAK